MNRRNMIGNSVTALLGIGSIVLGIKAAQSDPINLTRTRGEELHIFIHAEPDPAFQSAVHAHFMDRRGPVRTFRME